MNLCVSLWVLACLAQDPSPVETIVGKVEAGQQMVAFQFSPDLQRIAWAGRFPDGTNRLVLDGTPGPAIGPIHTMSWNPAGTWVWVQVQQGESYQLVIDGKTIPAPSSAFAPKFAPDGENFWWELPSPKGRALVVNQQKVAEAERFLCAGFKPGTNEFYYATPSASGGTLRIGAATQEIKGWAGMPWFSRDGKRMAIPVASVSGKKPSMRVSVDGKLGPEFDWIGGMEFSRDGMEIAYVAKESGRTWLTRNGTKVHEFDQIHQFDFSAAGLLFCSGERKGKKAIVVGATWHETDQRDLLGPWFADDGKRYAYWTGATGEYRIFSGDKVFGPFELASTPQFRPGTSVPCFWVRRAEKWWYQVGELAIPISGTPAGARFLPDGQLLLAFARNRTEFVRISVKVP